MRGLRIDEVVHQFQVGQWTIQVNALPPQFLNVPFEAVARLDDAGGFEDAAGGGRIRGAECQHGSIVPASRNGEEEPLPGGGSCLIVPQNNSYRSGLLCRCRQPLRVGGHLHPVPRLFLPGRGCRGDGGR